MRNTTWMAMAAVAALGTFHAASAAPAAAPAAKPAAKPAAAPAAATGDLKTDEERYFYAIGFGMGSEMSKQLAPSKAEQDAVRKGVNDALNAQKSLIDIPANGPKIQAFLEARAQANAKIASDAAKKSGEDYLAKASTAPGAKKTPSGLIYTEIAAGTGPMAKPTDTVKVNYKGTLTDGTEFDSSFKRGTPAEFPLNKVIPCWTEGVGMMKVGGKAKLVCPAAIAYGEQGHPPVIPGNSTLVFEVDLLEAKAGAP